MTSIGNYAFYECFGLQKVIISDIAAWCGIKIGRNFGCPLVYAHHLYSDENTEIKDLVIPDNVKSIGFAAFTNCSGLTSLTIPNSVKSIGEAAFADCSNLTSVKVLNPSPISVGYYTFSNRANATLYVPKGSKSAYQEANYWKEFKEIIEIAPSSIEQTMGSENDKAMIFTIDGKRVDNLKKGLNVIRMKDGTKRKVVVK
jgi:hypothetical protein